MSDAVRKRVRLICALIAIGCLVRLGAYYIEYQQMKATYTDISNEVVKPDIEIQTDNLVFKDAPEIDMETLKEKNSDLVAYIYIPDSVISFPVVKRDQSYYLDHDFNQNYSRSGCIFLDGFTKEGDQNWIFYGHNMHSNGMFHSLLEYLNNQEWASAHPIIFVYTMDEIRAYRVYGTSIQLDTSGVYQMHFDSEGALRNYANNYAASSNIDYAPEFPETLQLLTLSTCTDAGNSPNRVVVSAYMEDHMPRLNHE